jgi:hydroxymethylglutaryl-CoA synthase
VTQNVGITAFGAYLPRLRLDRASIAAAHAWAVPGLKGQGRGERAMADWDEDAITMAVEAARDCLQETDRDTITGAYLASTTLPFADRQNVGVVAAGLNLGRNITSMDITGSQRAGTSGLIAALRSTASGTSLYMAADTRKAKPASTNEFQFGHGAAALTLGTEGIIANFLGSNTVTADFVDHFRGSGEDEDYGWEQRWIRDEGYMKIVPEVVSGLLESTGVAGGDIDHFIMPCTIGRVPAGVAKALGVNPDAVRDALGANVGDTGAAHAILMLAHALEDAKSGEKILVVMFGQGADALLFEATDALASLPARSGVSGAVARGHTEKEYMKYLSFQDQVKIDFGMRAEVDNKTALTSEYRKKDMVTGFMGGQCSQCGTVQYPRTSYCVNPNCKAHDTQEPYPFTDTPAAVMSYTADWLSYSPSPPFYYGQVQFESGGRVLMGFTDIDPDDIAVGTALKMVFRIKDFDKQRGYRRYFWKAAPAA